MPEWQKPGEWIQRVFSFKSSCHCWCWWMLDSQAQIIKTFRPIILKMGSNTNTLVTFWFSQFGNENIVLPTCLGLSQSRETAGESASFFTCCGGPALGCGAGDVYYQRKRKHICLAHCDREQTPFSWSLNYTFEQDKCVPSHCLCPGMSDSKANARGLEANATDPKDQLLLFLQHSGNSQVCIYLFS